MKMSRRAYFCLLAFCLTGALVVANTAGQIEYWIAKSGFALPRVKSGGGNPKWRWPSEREDRYRSELKRARPFEVDRPLTVAEQKRIDDAVRLATEENTLHWWVESFGQWQYLLAPLLFVLSMVGLVRANRILPRLPFAVTALVAIVAMAMMWHRAYFTSLGW